jgi:hypothetical protein
VTRRYRAVSEPHLGPDELEEVIDALIPIVGRYGTLGIQEAMTEISKRLVSGEIEV